MFTENEVYLDGLVLSYLSDNEIELVIKEVEETRLEKRPYFYSNSSYHCIAYGNRLLEVDASRQCENCKMMYWDKLQIFLGSIRGGGL